MGWRHPDVSLEDLIELVKGFVDILILTSGYQSSGRIAHWDPLNINKAFQWASFFENVLQTFGCLDDHRESVKELDAALSKLTSEASFPQGLAHLSSATLTVARGFLVEHFIHTLPLRDSHLRAFLLATIEMDLHELSAAENDRLSVYLNKLKLQTASISSVQNRMFTNEDLATSPDSLAAKAGECEIISLTKYTLQRLLKRWSAVSNISTIERSLETISNNIRCSSWSEFDDNLFKEQLKQNDAPAIVEQVVGFMTWNLWKSKNLSYFFDKRAIYMISGASMIFSASKIQWVQVLERLNISVQRSDDNFRDTIELLLFGCIANRWTYLIEHLMSVSYYSITTSEQFHEVCKLLPAKFQTLEPKQEAMSSKESDILGYLTGILNGQLHPLWNVSPALAAVAIPSWSPLFRFYMNELELQFRGDFSTMRCCGCIQEKKEHHDCELAERIWCLYIFHVYGARQIHGPKSV
ncbi:fanconi anemia group F protein (FANCF) [Parasponia andersonii]|uniref:Fanconi anemia group F protein (FANCF) n=1 Tax=Parasponia andersonii TaxID=3476 RepID=A0A2P5B6E1_PARAD|nr:fanconi anemia group F protein (FANCF) [Parasponia andersonii]